MTSAGSTDRVYDTMGCMTEGQWLSSTKLPAPSSDVHQCWLPHVTLTTMAVLHT